VLVLVLAPCLVAQTSPDFDDEAETSILTALNQSRTERGLPPLKIDPKLRDAARSHTVLLVQHRALSHQFPGEAPLHERLRSAGLYFTEAAENVGMNTALDDVNSMFLRSPGHRTNMLNAAYDAVGIGVLRAGRDYWLTEDFARLTPELSAEQAENQVAIAFESKWKEHHPTVLKRVSVHGLRELTCQIARSGGKLQSPVDYEDHPSKEIVGYSTPDPSSLAPQVRSVLDQTHLSAYAVGACTPQESGSGSHFWIVMAFF